MSYLKILPAHIREKEIKALLKERLRWVNQQKKGFLRYRLPCEFLQNHKAKRLDCAADVVSIGSVSECSNSTQAEIRQALKAFMPWRKGPFSIFGVEIDAEWRSQRKWNRIEPQLPDLYNKVIADIGCNNGYYMFRMTPHQPQFILGFEPSVQHYYCFKALNGMAGFDNLETALLGIEHLGLFPETFDIIFLMGVIYHRASPVDALKDVFSALKPGGSVIIESQAIPGEEPIALFPERTYAKVPGTYFVPTGSCLKNWILRAGFISADLFFSHPMSSDEQRRTDWMVFESYDDFIDPDNPSLTIEGFPAPYRVFLKALKN